MMQAEQKKLDITVAICTRNRPDQLQRALGSLMEQAVSATELLVIDNHPSCNSTAEMVQKHFPSVRYVCEPVAGLDFARNRALSEANHDIIAFLDDDAVADRNWVLNISEEFQHNPNLGICTGRVLPLTLDTEAQRLFEANGGFARGEHKRHLPAEANQYLHGHKVPLIAWAISIGNGSSMALRKSYALELGGFDTALDLGAPVLPGGGDLDMFWRMLTAGYEMIYQPQVLTWHEHRRDLSSVYDQIVGHQRAVLAFLSKSLKQANNSQRFPLLVFLIWRLFKPGYRLLRRLIRKDPLPISVLWRMWRHCWSGVFAYPKAQRIAHHRLLKEFAA